MWTLTNAHTIMLHIKLFSKTYVDMIIAFIFNQHPILQQTFDAKVVIFIIITVKIVISQVQIHQCNSNCFARR